MGACMSKTGLFLSPEIQVRNVEVSSLGLSGVNLQVTLEATNLNPADLSVARIVYLAKKASNGTVIADGVCRKHFDIKASTATNMVVPMTCKYLGAGAVGKSIVARGRTSIIVSGEITFDAPMAPGGTATSRFEHQLDAALP